MEAVAGKRLQLIKITFGIFLETDLKIVCFNAERKKEKIVRNKMKNMYSLNSFSFAFPIFLKQYVHEIYMHRVSDFFPFHSSNHLQLKMLDSFKSSFYRVAAAAAAAANII